MTTPGTLVQCRGISCGQFVRVDHGAVPASKVTGERKSRGWYCERCAAKLGALKR